MTKEQSCPTHQQESNGFCPASWTANSHWSEAPCLPLEGGDEGDTNTRTDTTVLNDENDDITSFTRQQTTAIDTPNL